MPTATWHPCCWWATASRAGRPDGPSRLGSRRTRGWSPRSSGSGTRVPCGASSPCSWRGSASPASCSRLARVSGRWSAGLGLALGAGAAPAVLITEVAPAFHGMAWAAAGLLGWYAVAAVDRPMRGRALMLSAVAGALAGAVAASDALAVVAGLLPFAAVTLLVWLRARRVARIAGPVVLLGAAALSFIAVHAYMVVAGYSSGLGGGRTRGFAIGAIAGNARVVGRGLLDMADGLPMELGAPLAALPMALAVGLIAVAVAGVVVVTRRHAVTPANGGGLRGQVHDLLGRERGAAPRSSRRQQRGHARGDAPPADRLVSSQRYLTGIFLATVALLPLWARARHGRMAATFVVTLSSPRQPYGWWPRRRTTTSSPPRHAPSRCSRRPCTPMACRTGTRRTGTQTSCDCHPVAPLTWPRQPRARNAAPGRRRSVASCSTASAAGSSTVRDAASWWWIPVIAAFIPKPPPASLGVPVQIFSADRFTVYVYAERTGAAQVRDDVRGQG